MALHDELLTLVPWLRAHPQATIPEVAAVFGVDELRVRQYVLQLGITGFGEMHGELIDIYYDGDRIYLNDTLGLDRPYKFDAMQATCLLAGLDAQRLLPAAARGFTDEELEGAYAKISSTLKSQNRFNFVAAESPTHTEALGTLAEALGTGRQVGFEYWNDARDGVESRMVSPLRLRSIDDVVLLDAFCHTHDGWRTFQVDRIRDARLGTQAAALPAEGFQPMPTEAVEISVPLSRAHLLEQFVEEGERSQIDGRIHTKVRVSVAAWLARKVLASGLDIQVHSPQRIDDEVSEFVELAQQPYRIASIPDGE